MGKMMKTMMTEKIMMKARRADEEIITGGIADN